LELELELRLRLLWLVVFKAELEADGGRRKRGGGVSLRDFVGAVLADSWICCWSVGVAARLLWEVR